MEEFFEKMRQSIGRGMVTVGAKSKAMIETTKIKGQIGMIQEQKKSALEELGNIVYATFLKGGFDEERLKNKCEAVRALDAQVKDKEEELRRIHLEAQKVLGNPMIIARCDCGVEIYEGSKFCGKCGKKVQ